VQGNCSERPRSHRAAGLCALALSLAATVARADELREQRLEQQLQELRRQVDVQSRRIDQLERSVRPGAPSAQFDIGKAPAPAETSPWLVASSWERVLPGMSAEQVTGILGAPNSERPGAAGATTLLYALEVQEGVFLAGRVEMRDGKVTAVHKPELR
jgi:hypothetical protein